MADGVHTPVGAHQFAFSFLQRPSSTHTCSNPQKKQKITSKLQINFTSKPLRLWQRADKRRIILAERLVRGEFILGRALHKRRIHF